MQAGYGNSSKRIILTANFPQPADITHDVNKHGFCIYHNTINMDVLAEMKCFWSEYFQKSNSSRQVVRGNIRLGEENINGYSDNRTCCLYRDLDFLWNKPTHDLTRQMGIEIHRIRNLAQGFDPDCGFSYRQDCYGMYVSTSCYEAEKGWMCMHMDGHKNTPILQYMVNITHKGIDYSSGGLYLMDKNGIKIDIDAQMRPGSIVFFDGSLKHGVDTIGPPISNAPGRIATFAITTFFRTRMSLPHTLRRMEDRYWGIKNRIDRLKGKMAYSKD